MEKEDFRDYKFHILEQIKSFQGCKDAHQKNFFDIQQNIKQLGDEMKEELKDISSKVNRLDRRLMRVEIKSGMWGALAGTVPFLIWYLTKGIS